MSPVGVGSSFSTNTLRTGEAKLWILLVGINDYQDDGLPSLRYPAVDCQGLGEAFELATEGFPNKEVIIHHDNTAQPPTREVVRASLQRIVSQTQAQDSLLLYFSGHGMLEPSQQEAVLCMRDTRKDDLLATGLGMNELVRMLSESSANQQLLCLDTCHSGDMRLMGGGRARNAVETPVNPAPQMVDILRQRAAQSKGFCALLSCDQGQQSWEFPELGHGVFTYFLMQGLLGEAADSHGVIEADGLYKYVYRETRQYIDKMNQQLRLINQQKLKRGDSKLHAEYPLQTPKRIVEGVGELVLGVKAKTVEKQILPRRAVVIDGLSNDDLPNVNATDLSRVLKAYGGFEVEYVSCKDFGLSEIRASIQKLIRWCNEPASQTQIGSQKSIPTALLYLRGYIEEIEDGEAWLVLGDGARLSRSALRQELRRASGSKQIIILDCPEADTLENWIEDLQCGVENGQCLITAAAKTEEPEAFTRALFETLSQANSQIGLPVASWISELENISIAKGIKLHTWLSGTQAVIDILPGNISRVQEEKKPIGNTVNLSQLTQQPDIPTGGLEIDSEQYLQLEKLLKQEIGPIAPTILQQALRQVSSLELLVKNLAAYLAPEKQQHFQSSAMAILEAFAPQNKSGNKSVDEEFTRKCTTQLAYIIGPIANFMVQQQLKSNPQISRAELINKLVLVIPDPKQACKFEQRMLK
ncbi:peptidase C14 caspase catalytic subunit p20 [Calothrix sp. NIES-4071]|nr:peptidase C14 caspase catalytic subunit p20 [Calothrix sp. NIES-4071]BAZ60454.1 peptidase C14 caspase catalytic subunit p20 [Calothrix sp. NIES-4105]